MLIPASMKEKVRIRYENNVCDMEGRTFNSEHVVLMYPDRVTIIMTDESVKMEAEYEKPPKVNHYGQYVIISPKGEHLPLWDSLGGELKEEGDKITGEGEIGIRASMGRHYITIELADKNKGSIMRLYGNEVEVEAEKPDLVNVLGNQYQSFYLKTPKDSKTEVIKDSDKIKIKVTSQ